VSPIGKYGKTKILILLASTASKLIKVPIPYWDCAWWDLVKSGVAVAEIEHICPLYAYIQIVYRLQAVVCFWVGVAVNRKLKLAAQ